MLCLPSAGGTPKNLQFLGAGPHQVPRALPAALSYFRWDMRGAAWHRALAPGC